MSIAKVILQHCGQILGLEIVPQAIVDAKENATINNIANSEFFAGKAEEILGSVCYNSKFEDVFAVVDPPRAGLRKYTLQIIGFFKTFVLSKKVAANLQQLKLNN